MEFINGSAVYIHYGDDKFEKPGSIRNLDQFTKPSGGFWASRKGDPFGWKRWCEREDFRLNRLERSFEFVLKDFAKVAVLSNSKDLIPMPKLKDSWKPHKDSHDLFVDWCCLDFEALSKIYDAIEITNIRELYWDLYGWDCNSILIMNPDIVEVIERK